MLDRPIDPGLTRFRPFRSR